MGFSLTPSVESQAANLLTLQPHSPHSLRPPRTRHFVENCLHVQIFYPCTDHLCADSHNCCNHSSTLFHPFTHFSLSTAPKTLIPQSAEKDGYSRSPRAEAQGYDSRIRQLVSFCQFNCQLKKLTSVLTMEGYNHSQGRCREYQTASRPIRTRSTDVGV